MGCAWFRYVTEPILPGGRLLLSRRPMPGLTRPKHSRISQREPEPLWTNAGNGAKKLRHRIYPEDPSQLSLGGIHLPSRFSQL
jgi:hypothetical protein